MSCIFLVYKIFRQLRYYACHDSRVKVMIACYIDSFSLSLRMICRLFARDSRCPL